MFSSSLGVISRFEDKHSLLHPTFFIFGEKDDIIPLEQVSFPSQIFLNAFHACFVICFFNENKVEN